MASGLNFKINIWYLDDVTLMGDPKEVLRDLRKRQTESREIRIELNNDKSEVIIFGGTIEDRDAVGNLFDQCTPGIRRTLFSEATLLGSPLGGGGAGRVLMEQVTALERLRLNVKEIGTHNSLHLLKNYFFIPKLQYILRSSPTWQYLEVLQAFDRVQRSILQETLNVHLEDEAWLQAALPVQSGDLGICKAEYIAVPAMYYYSVCC